MRPPKTVIQHQIGNLERCKSAAVSKRAVTSAYDSSSFYRQAESSLKSVTEAKQGSDENNSSIQNQYHSAMSHGSKAIIEQKMDNDSKSHALKEELFKKYGSNNEMSMVDIYIQS